MSKNSILFIFGLLLAGVRARTCYECYNKKDCQQPSQIICPSDDYGCATAILDIEPWITKGCLSDDKAKGPLKMNGCKGKTKNGVTGQLCGCMGEDLCNSDCVNNASCPIQNVNLSPENQEEELSVSEDASKSATMAVTEGPKSSVQKSENYLLAFLLIPITWFLCFALMD